MAEKQTAGRNELGTFAPKFAELNDDVLFGDIWSRENQLSLRDSDGTRADRFCFPVPSGKCKEKWDYPGRNCRNFNPCRFLCRLVESVGGVPYGKGSVE